jgi:hypothetical protein
MAWRAQQNNRHCRKTFELKHTKPGGDRFAALPPISMELRMDAVPKYLSDYLLRCICQMDQSPLKKLRPETVL